MAAAIHEWLEQLGLGKYAETFSDNEIDLDVLPHLSDEDFRELGLPVGPRRKIQHAASLLNTRPDTVLADARTRPDNNGERRQVAVLFADLTDFTKLSTELDAEELHELLNRYFAVVDAIVGDYGGKIDKHIGDAVMAVFGAPVARTDDPVRAVRAASDIHQAIAELSRELGRSLQVHVGIASGQVVASDTGSQAHREYTVTGETVNLASRLDDMAEAGETLVSKSVYDAVSGIAECSLRGEVSVTGFDRPVPVWAVERINPSASIGRHNTFVGRGMELRQFQAFLDECLERGRGHNILVRGEPGIGKTRLVEQFISIAEARGLAVHRSLVLDFGVGKGQDAIATIARSLLGIISAENEKQRQLALEHAIGEGHVPAAQRVYLNDLLDLPQAVEQQSQYDAMDNDARNRGKLQAIADLIRRMARSSPLLVIFEDIHWADSVTLDLIRTLALIPVQASVLMVLTSRVEGATMETGWIASLRGAPTATIELQPLPPEETLELAYSLVKSRGHQIENFVARSEGNPLFLEQLLRNASEAGEEDIPGTLKGLVQARMDRLPRIDKQALTAASVIGQKFSLEAVRAIIDRPDYLCEVLLQHRLVRPDGIFFLFDHALIKDAVYLSLLTARRKELHSRAAEFYAGKDPVLHAQHLEMAKDSRAPLAFLEAAEIEARTYRVERARQLAECGLAIAATREDHFQLSCRLAEWQLDSGLTRESMATFERAAKYAEGETQQCRIEIGLASSMRLLDRQSEALLVLDKAESRARKIDAKSELAQICHMRGNLLFVLGNRAECRRQHQAALDLAQEAGALDTEARALGGLADASYAEGKFVTANEQFGRCVGLAEQLGLGRVAVANRSMMAITLMMTGQIRKALQLALHSVETAQQVGHDRAEMIGRHGAHQAHWFLGEPILARVHSERAYDLAKRLGSKLFEAEALLFLAEAFAQEDNNERALKLARESLRICREHGMAFLGPIVLSELALRTQDASERRACLAEAEDLLSQGLLSHNYYFCYRNAIEVSLKTGDWDDAERYANALDAYTSAEPMPVTDFLIGRARSLSRIGRGERNEIIAGELARLIERARTMEALPFLKKMTTAAETLAAELRGPVS